MVNLSPHANYYFEFSDAVMGMKLFPSKYMTGTGRFNGWREYAMNAERIWSEHSGSIWFVKHRTGGPNSKQVDLKEFMWVKLRAQDIK